MAIPVIEMRRGGPARAGTFGHSGKPAATGWHSHELHQLEYSLQGAVEVETETAHYLLPPQQAVWIPSGTPHETTVRLAVSTVSAFFSPELVPQPGERVRILAAPPLLREMLLYGLRWPIDRQWDDPTAEAFFLVLANLVSESLDLEMPLHLPTSVDPLIARVIAYTNEHLDTVAPATVARFVGISQRTLRRRFVASMGMSWRSYVTQSRLLRAMAMLAEPGPTVVQVAGTVGFESQSAFTRAFSAFTGETPTAYRHRVTARSNSEGRGRLAEARQDGLS